MTAGDCYTETETADGTTQAEASCLSPHVGEVIATGPELCPPGISGDAFVALLSGYVGVAESDLFDWTDEHGIGASARVEFDDGVVAQTMCALVAQDGSDLTAPYAAG